MEEHLPFAVEHDLRGPQTGRAARQTQEDMVGLLPIDNRGEPLGQAHPVPVHGLVDGDAEPETGEVVGHGVGQQWWRWRSGRW